MLDRTRFLQPLGRNMACYAGLMLLHGLASTAADPYGSAYGDGGAGYPAAPMIPWIGVPQRWFGRALYIPNPPVYAQAAAADQNTPYANFRWDYFYTATTPAPAAPAGGSTPAVPSGSGAAAFNDKADALGLQGVGLGIRAQVQKGKECQAITAANAAGSRRGVCMQDSDIARKCPSRISGDGRGCALSETCCVDFSPPKELLQFLENQRAKQQQQ